MKFKRNYTAVSRSDLFDRTFYIQNNPSIAALGIDPVIHYLKYGGLNGIDPSSLFSSSAYLENYPDVAIEAWNPLAHFELHGRSERRKIWPSSTHGTEGVINIDETSPISPDAAAATDAVRASRKNGYAYVDINNKCNLHCPGCVRGTGMLKNTSEMMPLDKFHKIVGKFRREGYRTVGLYNWTEPFLCKNLHEYVFAVKRHQLACHVSSNLSLPRNSFLPSVLAALYTGIDELFVSVSGFTQQTYAVYHSGGDVELVKENLRYIAERKSAGSISSIIRVRFLKFAHNAHEESLWASYASELGLIFESKQGVGDPLRPIKDQEVLNYIENGINKFDPTKSNWAKMFPQPADNIQERGSVCEHIFDNVVLDARGDVYLCCCFPNNVESLRLGAYLDLSEAELLLRHFEHKFCAACDYPRRAARPEDHSRLNHALETRERA